MRKMDKKIDDFIRQELKQTVNALKELAEKYPQQIAIALEYAKGLANLSFAQKKIEEIKQTMDVLKEVEQKYIEQPEMAYIYARGLVNLIFEQKEAEEINPTIQCLKELYEKHSEYMDPEDWRRSAVAQSGDAVSVYDHVCREFDSLLETYGYVREGRHYRVVQENTKTIACYCHFGIICALLSHLWNVSPFILWHGIALAPTSVTEIVSEERQQGIASFRALRIGDISHLYAGQEPPSFAARFCEVFSNKEQRH